MRIIRINTAIKFLKEEISFNELIRKKYSIGTKITYYGGLSVIILIFAFCLFKYLYNYNYHILLYLTLTIPIIYLTSVKIQKENYSILQKFSKKLPFTLRHKTFTTDDFYILQYLKLEKFCVDYRIDLMTYESIENDYNETHPISHKYTWKCIKPISWIIAFLATSWFSLVASKGFENHEVVEIFKNILKIGFMLIITMPYLEFNIMWMRHINLLSKTRHLKRLLQEFKISYYFNN